MNWRGRGGKERRDGVRDSPTGKRQLLCNIAIRDLYVEEQRPQAKHLGDPCRAAIILKLNFSARLPSEGLGDSVPEVMHHMFGLKYPLKHLT
jgi:hypothetical protein